MTLEREYVDPGYLLLERGRCLRHHLNALNEAHMRTELTEQPVVCIVGMTNYVIVLRLILKLRGSCISDTVFLRNRRCR